MLKKIKVRLPAERNYSAPSSYMARIAKPNWDVFEEVCIMGHGR